MTNPFALTLKQVPTIRWKPNKDLLAVGISWLLVVGALYAATFLVGVDALGGMGYFVLYAVIGATLFGIGIPLYWMVVVRRRSIGELGITRERLGVSVLLQVIFAVLLYSVTLARVELPPMEQLIPLVGLALCIGFFEAIFWRGWILLRLEEAFGILPAIVVGSVLYALYHIGYRMPANEMVFLFFVGVLYAVTFRLTKSIFILWPLFQPIGQLTTLIQDGLTLPLLAGLGFAEVLIAMFVLIWLANRYYKKHASETLVKGTYV